MSLGSSSLAGYLLDVVTIEPYTGEDSQQAPTYAAGVQYQAQVLPFAELRIDASGREFTSMATVTISGQQQIDQRSRVTGWSPLQPPIRSIRPLKGVGLDLTELVF